MNIRLHRCAATWAAGLALLGASPMLQAEATSPSTLESVDDAALATRVHLALDRALGRDAADLQVAVDHGTVTLSGWTPLPREESQARAVASRVPGVKQAYSRVRSWSSDDDR